MDKKEIFEKASGKLNINSIYCEEEKAALCGEIPMTEEIFERCRNIAFACCDTETVYYLITNFPEFPKK